MSEPTSFCKHTGFLALAVAAVLLLASCTGNEPTDTEGINSYLEGQLSVLAEVDSVQDYRGFEVLVVYQDDEKVDTLGFAETDSAGVFRMGVQAPRPGIYPLIISRNGTILAVDELAVAEGDSATVQASFPQGNRPLRIRSQENAAWMAYRNTKAQYNQAIARLVQDGQYSPQDMAQSVGQTASILWSMRENYARTLGADLASAESAVMMEGWNDSLVVARAGVIEPENAGFVQVARAARRAQSRLKGAPAGLDLLKEFIARARDDEQRAALHSELVIAYLENDQPEEAQEAALALGRDYPDTEWAAWARNVVYDFENLMPGMQAPDFSLTTTGGDTLTLQQLRGNYVLLEFYAPGEETYQRELPARAALFAATQGEPFRIVSVSMQPDSLLNEAFVEGRTFPGIHVWEPNGLHSRIANQYNVHLLPRRFLIDPDGKILSKYEGSGMVSLQEEVAFLLSRKDQPS